MTTRLLLNIGNTHTQLQVRDGVAGGEVVTFPTCEWQQSEDLPVSVRSHAAASCGVACVVPAVIPILRRHFPADQLVCITSADVSGLDFSCVDASTIGADRLANAMAAVDLFGAPVVVLDCGTAITVEAIDQARRFRGGAILPGRRMLRQALYRQTAQLPDVPMQETQPPALGDSTAAAIVAGVDLGILGAVDRLLESTCRELGIPTCPIVVTGGDAGYFKREFPDVVAAPPEFTLHGIAKIMEYPPAEG